MKIPVAFSSTLAVVLSFVTFFFIFGEQHTFHGVLLDPPQPASEFTLTDVKSGQPFHFAPEQGRITLLYFGYTNCPDVCPTTMAVWKEVKNKLGADASRVRFIFITVDPQRDTPAVMAKYMRAFDSDFAGLWGTPAAVAGVVGAYGVWVEKEYREDTALGYVVNHTASTFLIDPQGAVRVQYPFGTPAEAIVDDITYLLR